MANAMTINSFTTKYFGNNLCISDYLNDIRKYKVPTNVEEEELIERYKSGDMSARDELIVRNQRFIYSLAKIYAKNEDEVNDYISEGNIGLIQAFDAYDSTKGVKFLSFAVWYVRRSMNYYLSTQSDLVLRTNNMKLGKKIDKVRQRYYAETGAEATSEEIIDMIHKEYGIDICHVSDVYDVNVSSINDELSDDFTVENDTEFNTRTASTISYEDTVNSDYNTTLLKNLMINISNDDKKIVFYLFGVGSDREHSAKETAEHFGISPSKVSNIKNNVFKKLNSNRRRIKKSV